MLRDFFCLRAGHRDYRDVAAVDGRRADERRRRQEAGRPDLRRDDLQRLLLRLLRSLRHPRGTRAGLLAILGLVAHEYLLQELCMLI